MRQRCFNRQGSEEHMAMNGLSMDLPCLLGGRRSGLAGGQKAGSEFDWCLEPRIVGSEGAHSRRICG